MNKRIVFCAVASSDGTLNFHSSMNFKDEKKIFDVRFSIRDTPTKGVSLFIHPKRH
jgi:hypothetical protein